MRDDPGRDRSGRVGLIGDLLEENWPSMDLVAERLLVDLESRKSEVEAVALIRPPMRRRFSKIDKVQGFTADRLLNRFVDYPRFLRGEAGRFDLFHVVDHSYGQMVHGLPANRTVVTCHDLDTFRCLWEPDHAGRGWAFRAMTKRILSGLQKAAHVCCDSVATRDEAIARGVLEEAKTSVVPLGVRPEMFQEPTASTKAEVLSLLVREEGREAVTDILHVGSVIARKRIPFLLEVFTELKKVIPNTRLLRVGGRLTAEQNRTAARLGIADSVLTLPFLTPEQLAAVYRSAALVLLPSDAEGFGFPVLEAMAAGTPVLASDLPVLREVGGTAAEYAPAAALDAWVTKARELFQERESSPSAWEARRERGRAQVARFTWAETGRRMIEVYKRVLSDSRRAGSVP